MNENNSVRTGGAVQPLTRAEIEQRIQMMGKRNGLDLSGQILQGTDQKNFSMLLEYSGALSEKPHRARSYLRELRKLHARLPAPCWLCAMDIPFQILRGDAYGRAENTFSV